ncbi:MAG: TetR/AcrR family transcriptional regulator [Cyclobacteriaceae bacterium]
MRNPEYTRRLILSKATSLFNTKGFKGTSLSDITKATGLTKGAIYGNFENKDALAVASFDAAINTVLLDLSKRIKVQSTAPLKLKAIIDYYSEYIHNPPIKGGCPIINTSIEADDSHPMLRFKVSTTITMIIDSLKKIITRGIDENQIIKGIDVELYATMFYATIEGAIIMARTEGSSRSYDLIKKGLENQINAISI